MADQHLDLLHKEQARRQAAEARLAQAQALIQAAAVALIQTDASGQIRFANHAFTSLTGWSATQVQHRQLFSAYFWREAALAQEALQAIRAQGFWLGETEWITDGGMRVPLRISAYLHLDAHARPAHISLSLEDLSTQRRQQQMADSYRQALRQVYEQLPMGVGISPVDEPARFEYVNPALCRMSGYSPAQLTGEYPAITLLQLRQDPVLDQTAPAVFDYQQRLLHDVQFRRQDGSTAHADIHSFVLELEERRLVVSFFLDIEDRRKAIGRLRQAESLLQTTLKAANSARWTFDFGQYRLDWSADMRHLLGFGDEQGQDASKIFFERIHPEDRPHVLQSVEQAIARREDLDVRYRLLTAGQDVRHLHSIAKLQLDATGLPRQFDGIVQDLTIQAQMIEELEDVRRRFEHAQQMIGFGTFEWQQQSATMHWSETLSRLCEMPEVRRRGHSDELIKFIHPSERRRIFAEVEKILLHRQTTYTAYFNLLTYSQKVKSVHLLAEIEYDQQQQPKRIRGMLHELATTRTLDREQDYQELLLQNIHDAVISTDVLLRIKTWNKAAERLYGWESHEVLGKKLTQFVRLGYYSGSSQDQFIQGFFNAEERHEWTGRVTQKDREGRDKVIESSIRLLKDAHGLNIGLVAVNRDITNLTRMEEQAHRSQNMLQLIFDNIPDWIFWQDTRGLLLGCNQQFAAAVYPGTSTESVVGQSYATLCQDEAHAARLLELSREVVRTGHSFYHLEEPLLRTEGTIVWLDINLMPLRDVYGAIIGTVITAEDITEKRLIEEALREQQANLSSIIENTNDLIWYVDAAYRLLAFNEPMRQYASQHQRQTPWIGGPCLEFFPESLHQDLTALHDRALNGDKFLSDYTLSLADGQVQHIEVSCNPIRREDQMVTGVCYMARDVTQRRQQEQLLQDHLLKQEKVRSLALIQGQEEERQRVSRDLHDGVGQILTALQMEVSFLHSRLKGKTHGIPDKDLTNIVEKVSHAKQEVRRISHNLMPSILHDFGLADAIQQLCDGIAKAGMNVETYLQLEGRRFEAQIETGLYRIAQEVIANILKHSRAQRVSISLEYEQDNLYFTAEDDGVGFQAIDNRAVGSRGNGLANLEQRARLLGGTLRIHSVPQEGCSISVILTRPALAISSPVVS